MRGGYQPTARLEQDLSEVRVEAVAGAQTYVQRDAVEDALIVAHLATLRRYGAVGTRLADALEAAWRPADAAADAAVAQTARELVALSELGARHLLARG